MSDHNRNRVGLATVRKPTRGEWLASAGVSPYTRVERIARVVVLVLAIIVLLMDIFVWRP